MLLEQNAHNLSRRRHRRAKFSPPSLVFPRIVLTLIYTFFFIEFPNQALNQHSIGIVMDLTDNMKQLLAGTSTGQPPSASSSASSSSSNMPGKSSSSSSAALAAASIGSLSNSSSSSSASGSSASASAAAAAAAMQQQMLAAAGGPSTAASAAAGGAAGGGDGAGYVTEKLYMLLQLYLQNKGWSPSAELLQCFSELKDSAMLPSAGYLQ